MDLNPGSIIYHFPKANHSTYLTLGFLIFIKCLIFKIIFAIKIFFPSKTYISWTSFYSAEHEFSANFHQLSGERETQKGRYVWVAGAWFFSWADCPLDCWQNWCHRKFPYSVESYFAVIHLESYWRGPDWSCPHITEVVIVGSLFHRSSISHMSSISRNHPDESVKLQNTLYHWIQHGNHSFDLIKSMDYLVVLGKYCNLKDVMLWLNRILYPCHPISRYTVDSWLRWE